MKPSTLVSYFRGEKDKGYDPVRPSLGHVTDFNTLDSAFVDFPFQEMKHWVENKEKHHKTCKQMVA